MGVPFINLARIALYHESRVCKTVENQFCIITYPLLFFVFMNFQFLNYRTWTYVLSLLFFGGLSQKTTQKKPHEKKRLRIIHKSREHDEVVQ
jgi:hypothetical protein